MTDTTSRTARMAACRPLFPICAHRIYLNNAGVAPTSTKVRDAANRFFDDLIHNGLSHETTWEEETAVSRERSARILGAQPAEIALVRNTSHGLALVAEAIQWRPGDAVAVCSDVEYPSNVYPWLHLASRGVDLQPIRAVRGGVTVEAVAEALSPKTRLVAVSAVQYASGHRTDLRAVGDLCREHGILLCVDGIQQVGAFALDVKACGIHFLAADSHKWMLGVPGIGLLFVDQAVLSEIRPPLVGWKSTTDAWNFDRVHFELRADAAVLEEGSSAYALTYGFAAALEILEELGISEIEAHITALLARLEARLVAAGCDVGPASNERAGILSVAPPGGADVANEIAERCDAAKISVSVRRGRIRISPHIYNTQADIDAVAEVIATVIDDG